MTPKPKQRAAPAVLDPRTWLDRVNDTPKDTLAAFLVDHLSRAVESDAAYFYYRTLILRAHGREVMTLTKDARGTAYVHALEPRYEVLADTMDRARIAWTAIEAIYNDALTGGRP